MRRSSRIPKQIPILLIGSDLDGRVFSEPTTTVLLSLHGAGILSRHKLSPEQELVLRWTEKNKEAEIRVVGHIGEQSGRHTYGVAFFDPHLNFWEIDFPPISAVERELGFLSLVGSSCNTLEKVDDSSFEADICATNDAVLRYCKRCGSSTLWKPPSSVTTQQTASVKNAPSPLPSKPATPSRAPSPAPLSSSIPASASFLGTPPSPPPPQPSFYAQSHSSAPDSAPPQPTVYAARPDPAENPAGASPNFGGAHDGSLGDPQTAVLTISPPVPATPAAPAVNRRRHPRVKVSYSACVRRPSREDDIVTCEDMSKGGLRFKSRHQYYVQSHIEVAVPYVSGQPAIFVPALIVFVQELPEQHLFRCGVQYLKSTKPRDGF